MISKEIYIERRRKLSEKIKSGIILIPGNNYSPLDCKDNCYPFIQDATFKYYFGINHPGLIGVIDIDKEEEMIFGDDYSMDDIIWMGKQKFLKDAVLDFGIEKLVEKNKLKDFLKGKNVKFTNQYKDDIILYLSKLLNIDPYEFDSYVDKELIMTIIEQRNIKSNEEIEEIEKAVNVTREMHIAAMKNVKAGMKEYELLAEVEKACRKNNSYFSFHTILTKNGQILHNHSHNNILNDGDLVLLDCGAITEEGYCGDMTTTFPVSGKYSERQKKIHDIVKNMFDCAKNISKPGVEYKKVHLEVCKVMVKGLKDLGFFKADEEKIVEKGAHALFMPHGLGHMMGMTVHDMENFGEINVGYDDKTKKEKQFGLASLRLGRELKKGYVLTIEPGIYFIPELFEKWKKENLFSDLLNYDEIEKYMDFGGIRMERDILITESGCRILGDNLARTVEEIEEFMKK